MKKRSRMFSKFMFRIVLLLQRFCDSHTGYTIQITLREWLGCLPFSVRRNAVAFGFLLPLRISRTLLRLMSSPIGSEKKWIRNIEQKTWKGVWIAPGISERRKNVASNDLVILYIHGGGFCLGHSTIHMETFLLIINHLWNESRFKASILSVEYSLSPESVWPTALNESMDAYRYLIHDLGVDPAKIFLVGDSAGGNLVAAMLLMIKDQIASSQGPILFPAGAVLLSPWPDLRLNLPYCIDDRKHCYLHPRLDKLFVSKYIRNFKQLDSDSKDAMLRNPLISPTFGEFNGVCPIFLAYGDKELIRLSIEKFIENLKRHRCNLTVLKGENAVHAWVISKFLSPSKEIFEDDWKVIIDWLATTRKNLMK